MPKGHWHILTANGAAVILREEGKGFITSLWDCTIDNALATCWLEETFPGKLFEIYSSTLIAKTQGGNPISIVRGRIVCG